MYLITLLYFAALVASVLSVYFVRTGSKFWLLSIPLWGLLIAAFPFWRVVNDRQISELEIEYSMSEGNRHYGDFSIWEKLEKANADKSRISITFVYLVGLQTLVALIFQIIGEKRTNKRIYRWTKVIFALFLTGMVFIVVLMSIVPTGPLI